MAEDLSTYWKDGPAGGTPLDSRTLNDWGGLVEERADAAEVAANAATLTQARIEQDIASWATSTPAVTAALPWLAVQTSYTPIEEKLDDWWAAVKAGTAQAVMIGDSITEGTGATSADRRWQTLVQTALSPLGPVWPFTPAWPNSSATGYPVTRLGAVRRTNTLATRWGLGWRAAEIYDDTGSITFSFTGTSCKVMYTKASSTGVMTVQIDGATPVTIDTSSATVPPATNGATWSSGPLTLGQHTVVVRRSPASAAGQSVWIQGLLTYRGDEASGVRVLDAARHGISSSFMTEDAERLPALVGKSTGVTGAIQGAGGADLIVMALGTNDYGQGVPPATFGENVQALIAALRTPAPALGFQGSILLLGMYLGRERDPILWQEYQRQLVAIAAADPKVAYFDLRRRMPVVPPSSNDVSGLGLYMDALHPSDAGHQWIARVMTDYLTPRA